MSYIREVEPDEATGELKRLYDKVMGERGGRLPSVLKVMSLNPQAFARVEELNHTVSFGGSTLGRRREEMIATLVSTLNGCDY